MAISWYKDGRPLSRWSLSGLKVTFNSQFSSTFMVNNLTSAHSGNYTCEASNTWSKSRYTSQIKVNGTCMPNSNLIPTFSGFLFSWQAMVFFPPSWFGGRPQRLLMMLSPFLQDLDGWLNAFPFYSLVLSVQLSAYRVLLLVKRLVDFTLKLQFPLGWHQLPFPPRPEPVWELRRRASSKKETSQSHSSGRKTVNLLSRCQTYEFRKWIRLLLC